MSFPIVQSTAIPGLPEIVAILILVPLGLIPLAITYWIYRDAKQRGSSEPVLWALGFLIGLNLFILPGLTLLGLYFYSRSDITQPDSESSDDQTLDKSTDPYLQDEIEENIGGE